MKKVYPNPKFKNALYAFFALFVFFGHANVRAQTAASYGFSASSTTFSYLSGGTTVSALISDDGTATIPIGFTFNYCGSGYTQLKASSNGWLSLNASTSSTTWTNSLANVNTLKPVLMPWFDDMTGYASGAQVSYLTSGTTGSRVFTIEYLNWDVDYSYENNLTIQVKLYEATGVIQYIYKQESGAFYGQSASIGIADGAGTPTYLSLNGAGTSPTASSTAFTTSITSLPGSGQMYQFTPPVGCSSAPTAGTTAASSTTVCLGASTNLSLSGATSGAGIAYQWQSSPDNITYTNITGATAATYTATPTAATWYKCIVTCTSISSSATSSPVQITFTNSITGTTPNFRCGTGTVSLAATGSSGTTLKWYAAATGGSALGTGSPFTTPSIATTTNYYVGAETSASGIGEIGTGTSLTLSYSYPSAYGNYWYQDWQQIVYTAAELQAQGLSAGNITALAFNISGVPGPSSVSNYAIRIGTTTSTTLTGFTTTGLSTVYGPTSASPSSGWNTITFSSAYAWDGISNIIVDIRGDGAYGWANATTYYTTTSGNTCVYAYATSSSASFYTSGPFAYTSSSRPNIRFTGNKVCSSPRQVVTATVNAPPTFSVTGTQTICNNTVATMSVTSALSSYNTYVWSPATNLYTNAAATIPYTAGSSASTVYYKSTTAGATTYTCTANNTSSLCANTGTVTITNLPSTVTVTASPSNLCFSGNVSLAMSTAAYGAAQYQWQTSANNSTWADSTGSTASTLVTNTVGNTRYYRVVLKNSSGGFCLNATSDTALVYKPSVVTVANGARCSFGTVTLGATATDGSLDWYDASTGGSLLSTGSSYTTPSISSTTTYYVEATATPDINGVIGTGTSTTLSYSYPTAFGNYWYQDWQQIVYTAAELTAAGNVKGDISKVSFNIASVPGPGTVNGYALRMGSTTSSTLSTFTTTGLTTVFGPSAITPSSGVNTLTLSTPYYWDGVSNIIVDIRGNGSYGSANATTYYTATTGNTCLYAYATSSSIGAAFYTSSPTATTSTLRPNIQFFQQGCHSSRSPVVATVNPLPTPTISPSTGPIQICDGATTTFTGGGGGNYQWKNASGDIAGAVSSTYTTGTTGTYRVVVTNPTTGCKDSTSFVGVNVNPVPTVSIAPVGTTQICSDSSQKFTSTVTGSGLTYQWFNSGTTITGANKDSLRVTSPGVYTLRVYLGTCSDTSNEATLIVNPLPTASFTKTGTTGAICLGQTFELTALTIPATSTYQWSLDGVDIPGATSQVFNASLGGIYTVRIKDGNNCRKTSDTASLINTPMGVPKLSPNEARFCEGTILKLYSNAGPFASKFAWTRNGVTLPDTTAEILSGINGTYDVTVTDVYGCTLLSPKSVLTVDPIPTKPVIVKTGTVLSTVAPYYSYQWFRNGKAIPGATLRNFNMTFDGNYHVVVTNAFDCFNESDIMSVQALSVKTLSSDKINIDVYPNPSQNIINIAAPVAVNVMVQDVQGKKILSLQNATQVDMSTYADGIYIFTITDKEGMILKMDKVVKRTN